MKLGQLVSFIAEGLPPEAQQALASLQADVEPMAPSLAEGVVRDELGDDPEHLFLDWSPVPVAAASVGQVHRAVLHDGRVVAVKVQYPGVGRAIMSDLDNAELLYGMASAISLKGLDVKGFVDELRVRMGEELDYRREAANQAEFAALLPRPPVHPRPRRRAGALGRARDHHGVGRRPDVGAVRGDGVAGREAASRRGALPLRPGLGAPPRRVQRRSPSGELPLPRRRVHHVPRLRAGEAVVAGRVGAPRRPCLDAILDRQPDRLVEAMVESRFLPEGHGLTPRGGVRVRRARPTSPTSPSGSPSPVPSPPTR